MSTIPGDGEKTKRRPLPEAAYCQPDERNLRLKRAGELAHEIVTERRRRDMTPGQKLTAISSYARRIVVITDVLQELRP